MFSSGCHVDFHAVFYLKKKKKLTKVWGWGEGGEGRGGKEGVTGISGSPQVFLCLPFNIRHKLGKEAVFGLEFVTGLSFEQQFLVNQVHANNSAKFTQIHSRNHLLKSDGKFK